MDKMFYEMISKKLFENVKTEYILKTFNRPSHQGLYVNLRKEEQC